MKSPRYWALQPCHNVAKSVTVIFCRNEKPEILGIATVDIKNFKIIFD